MGKTHSSRLVHTCASARRVRQYTLGTTSSSSSHLGAAGARHATARLRLAGPRQLRRQEVQLDRMVLRLGQRGKPRPVKRRIHVPCPTRTCCSCAQTRLQLCHSGGSRNSSSLRTSQDGLDPPCQQRTTMLVTPSVDARNPLCTQLMHPTSLRDAKSFTYCPVAVHWPPCTRLKRFRFYGVVLNKKESHWRLQHCQHQWPALCDLQQCSGVPCTVHISILKPFPTLREPDLPPHFQPCHLLMCV